MHWLITYQQWTGKQQKVVNAVIDVLPTDWLETVLENCPEYQTVLINWQAITEDQASKLGRYI